MERKNRENKQRPKRVIKRRVVKKRPGTPKETRGKQPPRVASTDATTGVQPKSRANPRTAPRKERRQVRPPEREEIDQKDVGVDETSDYFETEYDETAILEAKVENDPEYLAKKEELERLRAQKEIEEKIEMERNSHKSRSGKKSKGINWYKLLSILLLLAGIILAGTELYKRYIYVPKKMEDTYKEAMQIDKDEMKNNLAELEANAEDDAFDFSQVEMITEVDPVTEINKKNVIGGLYIPDVGVKMPIMYGTTHQNMLAGVGTMKKSMTMGAGNYSLAGHNHPNPNLMLAPLKKMDKGMKMYITDKDKVYVYETDFIEVVLPDRTDLIKDGESPQLTLVSCYSNDGHDRIIVQGKLIDSYEYTDAGQDILKAFNDL